MNGIHFSSFAFLVVIIFTQVSCHPALNAISLADTETNIELQNQIKEFVAQYLAETGGDLRYLETQQLPSEFSRDRVRDRIRDREQIREQERIRAQERNREREQLREQERIRNQERIRDKHHHHKNPAVAALPGQAATAGVAAIPVLAATATDAERLAAAQAPAGTVPVTAEAARVDTAQNVRNDTTVSAANAPVVPVIVGTPGPVAPVASDVSVATTSAPLVTFPPRSTVDPVHALNQVDKILGNVANGNIVGIVDESLAIRAPQPVRNLVTNILKVVFCNPIDRLFRRCAPNQVDAAANSQTGK